MQINLKEETENGSEISVIAACIGRVTNRDLTDLLDGLLDQMTASEKIYYRKLYTELTFGKEGRESPL